MIRGCQCYLVYITPLVTADYSFEWVDTVTVVRKWPFLFCFCGHCLSWVKRGLRGSLSFICPHGLHTSSFTVAKMHKSNDSWEEKWKFKLVWKQTKVTKTQIFAPMASTLLLLQWRRRTNLMIHEQTMKIWRKKQKLKKIMYVPPWPPHIFF